MVRFLRISLVLIFSLLASHSFAGSALKTTIDGSAVRWETTVEYHVDAGALGSLSHAEAVALVDEAFQTWTDMDGSNLTASRVSDNSNVSLADSDKTVIVFDNDGSEMADLGLSPQVLAYGGFNSGGAAIKRGFVIVNGKCIGSAQSGCTRSFSEAEVKAVLIHETGHALGLGHTQTVSPEVYAQGSSAGFTDQEEGAIPTMFPKLMLGAGMETLHNDDKAQFLKLYGDTSDTCTVSGTVYWNDGTSELRGAEVVARNVSDEYADAYSSMSGAESPKLDLNSLDPSNCAGDCGRYTISGLKTGATYQICAQKIMSEFTGASAIKPFDPPVQGFGDTCPAELTVDCRRAGENIEGKDLVANPDGVNDSTSLDEATNSASSGGCSLVVKKGVETHAWVRMVNFIVSTW